MGSKVPISRYSFTNHDGLSEHWPLVPCTVPGRFKTFPQPVPIDNAGGPPYFPIFFPNPDATGFVYPPVTACRAYSLQATMNLQQAIQHFFSVNTQQADSDDAISRSHLVAHKLGEIPRCSVLAPVYHLTPRRKRQGVRSKNHILGN